MPINPAIWSDYLRSYERMGLQAISHSAPIGGPIWSAINTHEFPCAGRNRGIGSVL